MKDPLPDLEESAPPSPKNAGTSREQSKQKRRQQIIAAAERLILKSKSTDFSMVGLANEAGTSMKTTYNLIGSKSKVLYILLSGALDKLDTRALGLVDKTDVNSIVYMAEAPIGLFTGLPDFYRPLLRYLLGTPNSTERPIFMARAYRFWLRGLSHFDEVAPGKLNVQVMALHLHTYFAGALDLWVQDEIDAEEFRRHLRCAAAIALMPHVEKDQHPRLQAHLDLFQSSAESYGAAVADIIVSTEELMSG
jgi:AcrR family transcriptional regulator